MLKQRRYPAIYINIVIIHRIVRRFVAERRTENPPLTSINIHTGVQTPCCQRRLRAEVSTGFVPSALQTKGLNDSIGGVPKKCRAGHSINHTGTDRTHRSIHLTAGTFTPITRTTRSSHHSEGPKESIGFEPMCHQFLTAPEQSFNRSYNCADRIEFYRRSHRSFHYDRPYELRLAPTKTQAHLFAGWNNNARNLSTNNHVF